MLDVLKGVTVLDLTFNVAGPYCTMVLADLGATIWKIEPPAGDVVRSWPPFGDDGMSTTFISLNRGKQSVVLDLKSEEGSRMLLDLVGQVDVLVSSMRPGVLDSLGIDVEELRREYPDLVVADISAFGGRGRRGQDPGFDAVLQAYTGIMDLTGYPDQAPARVGTAILDVGTGMWCALGIIASLLVRERDQQPAPAVSATLFGTAVGFLPHHLASAELGGVTPTRLGTAQHNSAPYSALTASDGFVMVGVTGEGLWDRFVHAIGAPHLLDDPRFSTNADRVAHRDGLDDEITQFTSRMDCDALVAALESATLPCSKVRTIGELISDPQLSAAGLWADSVHGGHVAVAPVELNGQTPVHGTRIAPALGAQTCEVVDLADTTANTER